MQHYFQLMKAERHFVHFIFCIFWFLIIQCSNYFYLGFFLQRVALHSILQLQCTSNFYLTENIINFTWFCHFYLPNFETNIFDRRRRLLQRNIHSTLQPIQLILPQVKNFSLLQAFNFRSPDHVHLVRKLIIHRHVFRSEHAKPNTRQERIIFHLDKKIKSLKIEIICPVTIPRHAILIYLQVFYRQAFVAALEMVSHLEKSSRPATIHVTYCNRAEIGAESTGAFMEL